MGSLAKYPRDSHRTQQRIAAANSHGHVAILFVCVWLSNLVSVMIEKQVKTTD